MLVILYNHFIYALLILHKFIRIYIYSDAFYDYALLGNDFYLKFYIYIIEETILQNWIKYLSSIRMVALMMLTYHLGNVKKKEVVFKLELHSKLVYISFLCIYKCGRRARAVKYNFTHNLGGWKIDTK